jgi:hypothetical protein
MPKVQQKSEVYKESTGKLTRVSKKPTKVYRYKFNHSIKNPSWSIEKLIPLRSCLIHNNSSKLIFGDMITNIPKWLTVLDVEREDISTGEIENFEVYTNDFKSSNNRKIKTIEKFCNFYEPLYKKRKVSVLFHTFTRSDLANLDISTMLECAKVRYKSLNRPIRGYLWVRQLKENDKMDFGYHIHYHLVVAIDRLKIDKIPKELKFDDLWGQRTDVQFVKKSVRRYLMKELNHNDAKLLNRRQYSISSKLV